MAAEVIELNDEPIDDAGLDITAAPPVNELDENDVCGEPVQRDSAWVKCGWPNTHTVVFAGTAPQRFCEQHHVDAKPGPPAEARPKVVCRGSSLDWVGYVG